MHSKRQTCSQTEACNERVTGQGEGKAEAQPVFPNTLGGIAMGTKLNPGKFDCYDKALPDEPRFTILARDPDFFDFVSAWAQRRQMKVDCGDRPPEDQAKVDEAYQCAEDGQRWRRENNGKWRQPDDKARPAADPSENEDIAG